MPFTDDSGVFTEDFTAALPGMLGDTHKDMDFSSITDVQTLVKSYADNKAFAGKKLENVIQKPSENATDEDKAAYRTELGKAVGVPGEGENYEFFHAKPEERLEGWTYNETIEKGIAAIGKEENVSKKAMSRFSQFIDEQTDIAARQQQADQQAAYDTAFTEEQNALRTNKDWLGDATPKNLRAVLDTIENFGSDDLKAKVKEAGLYDKASIDNLKDWESAGIPIANIPFLLNVGNKLKGGQLPKGELGGGGNESEYAKNKRLHPTRPEIWGDENK